MSEFRFVAVERRPQRLRSEPCTRRAMQRISIRSGSRSAAAKGYRIRWAPLGITASGKRRWTSEEDALLGTDATK